MAPTTPSRWSRQHRFSRLARHTPARPPPRLPACLPACSASPPRACMQPAGVQYILDTVVQALQANPARKFIYSEMVGGAGARRGGGRLGEQRLDVPPPPRCCRFCGRWPTLFISPHLSLPFSAHLLLPTCVPDVGWAGWLAGCRASSLAGGASRARPRGRW